MSVITYLTSPLSIWLFMCLRATWALSLLFGLKIHPLSTSCRAVRIRTVLDSSHPPVSVAGTPERGSTHSLTNQSIALVLAWLASDRATMTKNKLRMLTSTSFSEWNLISYLDNGIVGWQPTRTRGRWRIGASCHLLRLKLTASFFRPPQFIMFSLDEYL